MNRAAIPEASRLAEQPSKTPISSSRHIRQKAGKRYGEGKGEHGETTAANRKKPFSHSNLLTHLAKLQVDGVIILGSYPQKFASSQMTSIISLTAIASGVITQATKNEKAAASHPSFI